MSKKRKKTRVGIIFGGKSAEHEISLLSTKNVVEAIDKEKYEIVLIGIDKKGHWYLNDTSKFLLDENDPKWVRLHHTGEQVALVHRDKTEQFVNLSTYQALEPIDVAFPILHGPFGEDGTVQGLLKLVDIPFVGCGVLGSAVAMDKDVSKRLFRSAGILIGKFLVYHKSNRNIIDFKDVKNYLGLPLFIKPANLGSSVGISKVLDQEEFEAAIDTAFEFDNKILIEEFIKGREIECAILGNENPIASIPGEILPQHDFYSYDAKYIDEKGAILKIPAELPDHMVKKVQNFAIRAFTTLCCEGMARVDLFLKEDETLIMNEINTIPGFTKISMYPRLLELSGISYTDLIDRLIQLALQRYDTEKKLKTVY